MAPGLTMATGAPLAWRSRAILSDSTLLSVYGPMVTPNGLW